jgi:hypothetical protein
MAMQYDGGSHSLSSDSVTGIIYHKIQRIGWHHSRHSFLVDLGNGIEIQQMEVSCLFENQMLAPPFPETRFFEIEIDEMKKDGAWTSAFQNICPVRAQRKPDWHILRFRIRRGTWMITERIQSKTPSGDEIQWIYTDDFNILFLSSGGHHDLQALLTLITAKLDTLAESIRSGVRIPSEFENQISCRTAFHSIFSEGIDGAFRDAVIYQQHGSALAGKSGVTNPLAMGSEICSNHGRMVVKPEKPADLTVDLTRIDDLQDLSWLND